MTARRNPLLVLLLVLAGLLAPGAAAATGHATGSVVRIGSARTTADAPTPDRADHRSQRPLVAAAPAAPSAPLHSTPARDARPSGPRLLLVQLPRPPSAAGSASELSAPTGRSPPSPAGT